MHAMHEPLFLYTIEASISAWCYVWKAQVKYSVTKTTQIYYNMKI